MHLLRIFVVSCLFSALFPVLARAQAAAGPMIRPAEPAKVYENTAEGLRLQLLDALAAAQDHDRPRLELLIREMEIPNYEMWFTKTYGQAKGQSWTESYGRELANRENDLEADFIEFGMEGGEFATRKVNDTAEPGMEAGMLAELQQPADIFYAGWKRREIPPTSRVDPIGYFVFVDGRFRWDSTIVLLKIHQDETRTNAVPEPALPQGGALGPSSQLDRGTRDGLARPGVAGVTYPMCTYCPDPLYPPKARHKHLEGRVVFTAVIETDGSVDQIELVKASDPIFVDNATEAVKMWRLKPARNANGEPVRAKVPIEITFRLLR